jgi:hypothetical protein
MTIKNITKLFAQIENDAHLSGTFDLEGVDFAYATQELQQYLLYRKNYGKSFPAIYSEISRDLDYLVSINNQLKQITGKNTPAQINSLGAKVAEDFLNLELEEKRLIPGGWTKEDGGGHRMIYQVTRKADGYHFTAINAGAGLRFHQKKSALHKELYNPTKTWHFPAPATEAEKAEIGFFIGRLLLVKTTPDSNYQKKPTNAESLYKEILPSISHIGGKEIETDPLPEHAYTSGQLTGTCTQRCIHQMLKVNSSEQDYLNFIFDYKHYKLVNYVKDCLNGLIPFTAAIKHQIQLAIENNFKILNRPKTFADLEIDNYSFQLKDLEEKINKAPLMTENQSTCHMQNISQLVINCKPPVGSIPRLHDLNCETNFPAPITPSSANFLFDLNKAIQHINNLNDNASSYYYIEQLISSLPTDTSKELYKKLSPTADYEKFSNYINQIQNILIYLQNNWLKEEQLPAFNIMILKVMKLQMNIQAAIAQMNKLPDFKPFVEVTIETVIGNTQKNPFWATNQPNLDKTLIEFQEYNRPAKTHEQYYSYLKTLLATETELNNKLALLYDNKFGHTSGALYEAIKKNGLQSLYMISLQMKSQYHLGSEFNPIIKKIQDHLNYESKLRGAINPFFKDQLTTNSRLDFTLHDDKRSLLLYTPLYPSFITWQELSDKTSKPSYPLEDSPAIKALTADTATLSAYKEPIQQKSANEIQLQPLDGEEKKGNRAVTQADIVARDYFHLRNTPSLQIALTVDYFTRHIAKLSERSNQVYVEANLMQPGLLRDSLYNKEFLPQFETFLKKGRRFFNKNGQYSSESLFFLRLDFLVSRYVYLTDKSLGLPRLQAIQEQLLKQLSEPNDPEIIYVQQQYLFLTLMTQISFEEKLSELSFTAAMDAYFYIQSHANPNLHNDTAHRVEVDKAIAKFKILATQLKQTPRIIEQALNSTLAKKPSTKALKIVGGTFPNYRLENDENQIEANILLGKLFEKKMARTSLPLAIKNHPLIKHLGLEDQQECLMSANETYMVLPHKINEIQLFHSNNNLTIQKKWQIDGSIKNYELHALSSNHLAKHASKYIHVVHSSLPKILTDNSMDYWQDTKSTDKGLLVKNNIPLYYYKKGDIYALDEQGNKTPYRLERLNDCYTTLRAFESDEFILAHSHPSEKTVIKLPRYNLNLTIENSALILQDTGEQVIERPSCVHPSVAGLALKQDEYLRFLMPVARFYPTKTGIKQGDFYPVLHDTTGKISTAILEKLWKSKPPLRKPLWDYQGSEKHISFRIQDGELIADSVADALYLAYTYLSTHQPEKAWKILDDCNARLGGLTGNPAELQYIAWICAKLPKSIDYAKKAYIETPPYVACRLKAISLLSDYLLQDRKFDLKPPKNSNTANSEFALDQHKELKKFIKNLPETIYFNFTNLQKMRRHLEYSFMLSTLERKRLLDYYQQSQSKYNTPRGALGYEWMCLSLSAIQEERDALQARIDTGNQTESDSNRFAFINKRLSQIKPVVAQSTILEKKKIDLSLSGNATVNQAKFSNKSTENFEKWNNNLTLTKLDSIELNEALNLISSSMKEHDFITHFPAFLQIALSENEGEIKRLSDFCTNILIANRHVSLDKQDSNIPLLSNVLYRVLNNRSSLRIFFSCASNGTLTLTELIQKVRFYKVPKLKVYQAKDVYKDILATPEEFLAQERPKSVPLVTQNLENTSLLEQSDIKTYLDEQQRQPLDDLISSYRELSKKGAERIAEADTEGLAGKELLALEQSQKSLGKKLLETPELVAIINDLVSKVDKPLTDRVKNSWDAALKLANQGPDDFKKKQSWDLEKQSKARAPIIASDLLSMFCRADLTYNIEKTGLSAENAQGLHDQIHTALFYEIQSQLIKNIGTDFNKAITTDDADLATQVLDFLAKESLPGLDEPATVILQKAEEILLRPRQVAALNALLKPKENGRGVEEKVEKIMPGGGKTKVILPIYAEKLAQGDNLVVVEVPPASLATNHVDLNRGSQRLFGKRAYRFEFDRDSNSSPERLEEIYKQFIEIMTTRSYMVTTGDSIKALELKYIELLLLNEKDQDKTWEKQIYWLDKITNILRNYTDAIIDEVHQGLWFRKKLIYTTGDSKPISPALIQHALGLYSFIDTDFIKNAPQFSKDYDWASFKQGLAKKIISDPTSPLNTFFNQAVLRYGPEVEAELNNYILGICKTMPEAILHANPEDKAALAFYKQEVSSVLQDTLCRKLNVNYGASERENLSPAEATLAIPFIGNTIPNEQSRFGNEFVSINNTLQMMLIKGISKDLLADQIAAWQVLARLELSQNSNLKNLDETPTARGFALLEGNTYTLSQVDLKNSNQMDDLHRKYKDNRSLQFLLLKDRLLKQIQQDSGFIQSDSFNHVDIYRSGQGVSGTPGEEGLYHQRLKFDKKTSLGSDAYVIELLGHKKTELSFLDYENPAQFIKKAFTNSKKGHLLRAIIDINATFTGVTNLEVARAIADFAKENPNFFSNPLKHVLYFNADQVLCALDINKPDQSIVLGTSEEKEIARLLRSTPAERFTYYDQVHTLGTDLKQFDLAHALVLADEKEFIKRFIQGVLRFRSIGQKASVEIILPTRVQGMTFDEFIERLTDNEQKDMPLDNLFSAKSQMNNLLRRTCLSMVQDLASENAKEKAKLTQTFELLFKEVPSQDLFALYGGITRNQKVTDIFSTFKTQLLELWRECHKKAAIELPEQKLTDIGFKLQKIIDTAIPFCLDEYEEFVDSVAKEVQVQKMIQKQVERVELKAFFDANLSEAYQKTWSSPLSRINIDIMTSAINRSCNSDRLFSPNLRVSKNYADTYREQKQTINAFIKPVFLVWYHIEYNEKKEAILEATIVTPREVDSLSNLFRNNFDNWISTTQDTVVAGKQPPDILSKKRYQSLREQVRFFNGEFLSLLEQDTPLTWLKENIEEKLSFFERHLQCYRPDCETGLHQLKTALTQGNVEGFAHIAKFPFKDQTQTDWKTLFPKTIPVQAAEYKRVAEAFQYMNEQWLNQNLVLTEIEHQFGLAINSLGYVDDHLKYLAGFKQLLRDTAHFTQPFLQRLNTPLLESYLGISVNSFYERQGISPLEIEGSDPKWQIASLEALNVLRTHPALQGKNDSFGFTISELAAVASTPEFLLRLIKEEPLSDALIANTLRNKCCDETITQLLFDSKFKFGEEELVLLAKQSKNIKLVENLLKRENLSEKVLQTLCEHNCLTEKHLLLILKRTTNDITQQAIYKHPAANSDIQNAIFKHEALHPDFLLFYLTQEKLNSDLLLEILKHPKAITERVLTSIIKLVNYPEILLAALNHSNCNTSVRFFAIDAPSFSQIANEIIKSSTLPDDHIVLKKIMSKMFEEYNKSEEKENWEKILIQVLNIYPSKGEKIGEIITIIKQNAKNLSSNLGFILFDRFEMLPFSYLPMAAMIRSAGNEILIKFTDINKTGILDELMLTHLGTKCHEKGLLNKFLLRKDLSDNLIDCFLKKFTLDETQLLLALEHVTERTTLAAIYNYPKVTQKVRDSVLVHKALSAELVEPLVLQKVIDDKKLIQILSSEMVITSKLFKTIIKQTANPDVLLAVLKHPLNSTVIQKIIKNPQFSPLMAQQFIASFNTDYLLLKLANLAFSKIKTDKEWENCLIKIFERSVSNKNTSDLIKTMIQENKSILSTKLGFNILRIFGNSMAIHLSSENMIAKANESELEILLVPSCVLSEEMQLWLVEKCNSVNLIDQILRKECLSEKAFLAILKKENLNENQLEVISKKAKSSLVLEPIHNHKAATNPVKTSVYLHPMINSKLLLELNIEDEAWPLILNTNTHINGQVLIHIAKTTTSEAVLQAVAEYYKTTNDIVDTIISNVNFSSNLANWMLESGRFSLEYEIFQKIIRKGFEHCRIAKNQELKNWENCLIKALKKYHERFNDNEMVAIIRNEQIRSPKLGMEIFKLYERTLIDKLPLKTMIQLADKVELRLLVNDNYTGRLTEEILTLLANKTSSKELINIFLLRPELNANVLQIVLAKALDYQNLHRALTHPNFTEADQQNWLERMTHWQANRKEELLRSPDDKKLKLSTALDALRLKACEHALKALKDDTYIQVADTAINLYQRLHQEVDAYLDKKTIARDFQANCKCAINEALPILGTHRGYKQIFMDILNVILSAITFKYAWSNKWRFFELKTATVEAVDEFDENVDDISSILAG